MKIYDAIYTAAVFLQLDALTDGMNAAGFSAEDPNESLQEDERRELDILLRCCNLVLGELSEEFPLNARIDVQADGGIPYTALPANVAHVVSVEKEGKRVPFSQWYDRLTFPASGNVTVCYTRVPPAVALADRSPYPTDVPSARTLAYGIAREYCLISGMTDEAALWDGRFVAAVNEQSRPRKEKRVRARAWR